MPEDYEIINTYRDDIDPKICTAIDDENIIIGLFAMDIKEVALVRYDRFLAILFVESEYSPEPLGGISEGIATGKGGPLIPYGKLVAAKRKWKSFLAAYKRWRR